MAEATVTNDESITAADILVMTVDELRAELLQRGCSSAVSGLTKPDLQMALLSAIGITLTPSYETIIPVCSCKQKMQIKVI